MLKQWKIEDADPKLKKHEQDIGELQDAHSQQKGALSVITWLTGLTLTLVIGLTVALFAWALNHVQIKASVIPDTSQNQTNSAQKPFTGP